MLYCKKSNYSAFGVYVFMQNKNIYVSDLSTSRHNFKSYHFCRGNSNKRKTRIGIILKGSGTYIYLNKKLNVAEGDVVFIPENIYCYSEWHGDPDIDVVYVSGFIHYDGNVYEPQTINCNEFFKNDILKISGLLCGGEIDSLEAYSLFYKVLQHIIPQLVSSDLRFDRTLQTAIEYITDNWDKIVSVMDIAKKCCVSESKIYHLFKAKLGQTPIGFLNSIKINVAIEYLENRDYSISTISRMVGFNSENHFRKVFAELTGTTPLKYRKNTV